MLILSRKPGEILFIGADIQIQVIAVKGMQVRLGITAPRNIAVDREEIAERKKANEPRPASR
jgi:carbon storage regulator